MSHFSVMVMTIDGSLDVDDLLEPYSEDNGRAPWIEYTRQEAIDYVRKNYSGFNEKTDEECWKCMAEGYEVIDKIGNLYATYNPDSKWDWWVDGGSWEGFLRLKDGTRANFAKIKDIDFSLDEEAYNKALHFWDVVVEHKPLKPDEQPLFNIYSEDYYREFFGSRENYVRRQAAFHIFAVVTSDGIWYEPSEVGCFGMSDETPESAQKQGDNFIKNFIDGKDAETMITVVDCHIQGKGETNGGIQNSSAINTLSTGA